MNYEDKKEDKKIVGIIATNVEVSIALNVIGHLSIFIGKYSDGEIMGKEIITDKSGVNHLGISKFPFKFPSLWLSCKKIICLKYFF